MAAETQATNEATSTNETGDEAGKDQEENGASLAPEEEADGDGEAKDGEDPGKDGKEEAPDLPDSADKYDLTIPADIGLKDENGDPLQFSADDPIAQDFRKFALENKFSQATVAGLVKMYGQLIKGNIEQTTAAHAEKETAHKNAELAKLEVTDAEGKKVSGGQRIETLVKSLDAAFGKSASKIIRRGLISSTDVIEAEKLVASFEGTAGKGDQGDDLEGLRGSKKLQAIRNRGK